MGEEEEMRRAEVEKRKTRMSIMNTLQESYSYYREKILDVYCVEGFCYIPFKKYD